MKMVIITALVSCMLLGCSLPDRNFPEIGLSEFDSARGINIFIQYDDYKNINWKGLLDELSHIELGFFHRIYIGEQFVCLNDYPYGRPDDDFDKGKKLKSLKFSATDEIENFDRWVSGLFFGGVDISIGSDVSLDRVIAVLDALHSHRIRPYVLFFDTIEGDFILFREAFLGPRPQVWENAPPGWKEYRIIIEEN